MEYERFIVSLYESDNPLPKMFVDFYKRSNKVIVKLQQAYFKAGYLFFYNKNYSWCEVKANSDEFVLDLSFDKKSSFAICFISDKIYVGKNNIEVNEIIINGFTGLHKKIIKERNLEEKRTFDKNFIVDNISHKLFGFISEEYYLRASKNISEILSLGDNASCLENLIKNSRFVKIGESGEEVYIGMVYKKGRPYYIAMGNLLTEQEIVDKMRDNCKLIHSKNSGEIFCLEFRRASDGEIL